MLHPLSFPTVYFISLSFPLHLLINSVPIYFTTFYQKRQTKINATSISNVFVPCASHFFLFALGAEFYNREPPQERERHKNHKFRLGTYLPASVNEANSFIFCGKCLFRSSQCFFHNFRGLQWIPLRKAWQPTSKQQLWRILGFHLNNNQHGLKLCW